MQTLTGLSAKAEVPVSYQPDAPARAALAAALEVPEVRKLRLEGRLVPEGKRDWRLEAMLGATVIQSCVVTLAPVTSRIDEEVTRRYLAHMPEEEPEPGAEVEMPDDTDSEPLPEAIDLAQVALEALALALPPYPRADGAGDAGEADLAVTEPGKAPMTDDDARPFAGLAGLRDQLAGGGDDAGNGSGDPDDSPAESPSPGNDEAGDDDTRGSR